MSRTRAYSNHSKQILSRFFETIELLNTLERLPHGLKGFCADYEIDYRNFQRQRKDHTRGNFQPGWLVPLVDDYCVSAKWLLTGKGKQFTSKFNSWHANSIQDTFL